MAGLWLAQIHDLSYGKLIIQDYIWPQKVSQGHQKNNPKQGPKYVHLNFWYVSTDLNGSLLLLSGNRKYKIAF